MPQLNHYQKTQIIQLWERGLSVTDIALQIRCSRPTVNLWLDRYFEEGTLERREGSGRPFKTTAEEEAEIYIFATNNSFESAARIIDQLNLDCCPNTVLRVLKGLGIKRYRAAQREILSELRKNGRLRFANEYRHWTPVEWNGVAFTDEKTFQSYPNGTVYVFRPKGHRSDPHYFSNQQKSGRFSVNCHMWLRGEGLGELTRIQGRYDSAAYTELLTRVLPNIIQSFGEQIPIFMHDRAPIHDSYHTRQFLSNYEGIALINWPYKGADLNPCEIVWSYLQRGVSGLIRSLGKPQTNEDLWAYIQVFWGLLTHNTTQALINSLPNKIQTIRERNGDWAY